MIVAGLTGCNFTHWAYVLKFPPAGNYMKIGFSELDRLFILEKVDRGKISSVCLHN